MPKSNLRTPNPGSAAAAAELRQRLEMMLDAFERAEPASTESSAMWRVLLDKSTSLTALKALARELRGRSGALRPAARRDLDHALRARFGPDPESARDALVVAAVCQRGRIRSDREYRVVAAYADSLARDATDAAVEAEYVQLGALLDAFMAGM